MPKIEKVIIHYGEKRSANFQSAEFSMSVEVSLSEGDSPIAVIDKHKAILRDQVTGFTLQEVDRLVDESRNGPRRK